jgi:hypothetical protein
MHLNVAGAKHCCGAKKLKNASNYCGQNTVMEDATNQCSSTVKDTKLCSITPQSSLRTPNIAPAWMPNFAHARMMSTIALQRQPLPIG